ncbi:MAG TPA: choice-of-anchor Q domain-containing protein [Anaerolineales bacterium]|nr:choice-of-anchor Q domain-containing protein [Anaerolineales bacterium]
MTSTKFPRRAALLVAVIVIIASACSPAPQTEQIVAETSEVATAVPGVANTPATTGVPTPQPLSPVATSSGTPRVFFTDLESGPNTGGQDDLGAFISIYGEGFGATQGNSTVTMGGQEVARYILWGENNAVARGLDMIVVQPGPNVTTGDIIVTVDGQSSNPLPFTVRSGNIYFVTPDAPNAEDANPGTYAEPFQTLYRPRQVMQAGDIVYLKGGTFSTSDPANPGWDAVLLLHPETDPNGTADRPVAYIGYPGDRPLIDAPEPLRRGIYMDQGMMYYIIANLAFTQGLAPYEGMLQMGGNGHRAVGNYLHDALSSTAMGIAGNSAHYQILGNLISNNGQDNWEDGVGFYIQGFGTNEDVDFGWNEIRDQRGRRAIQLFGHEDGDRMDNVRIHDNLISSSLQLRNNILLGGSDGGTDVLGTIYVYNNIIVGSDWEGLRVNDPQGTVFIQNNVLYDNGSLGPDSHAQIHIERAGAGLVTVQNNIVYAESGQTYFEFGPGADPSALNASHNLVYNAGACPAWDAGCVNADPLFSDIASLDFRLQAGSPAVDAGMDTGVVGDFAGIARPQGGAYDVGAYELTSGS